MRNIGKIKELGKSLPRGAKRKIALKSGLSVSLVVQFYLGAYSPRKENIKIILKATNEVLEELKKEEQEINTILDNINI